jgi:NADPH:quinone reductase-like Zn-dependent oxidoreductase
VVLDTVGSLPIATARSLVKPGGRIVDIVPSPLKLARSVLPGAYSVFMGRPEASDLAEVAEHAERGEVQLPIARTVPLAEAIAALTELESGRTPTRGKLVIALG